MAYYQDFSTEPLRDILEQFTGGLITLTQMCRDAEAIGFEIVGFKQVEIPTPLQCELTGLQDKEHFTTMTQFEIISGFDRLFLIANRELF